MLFTGQICRYGLNHVTTGENKITKETSASSKDCPSKESNIFYLILIKILPIYKIMFLKHLLCIVHVASNWFFDFPLSLHVIESGMTDSNDTNHMNQPCATCFSID